MLGSSLSQALQLLFVISSGVLGHCARAHGQPRVHACLGVGRKPWKELERIRMRVC